MRVVRIKLTKPNSFWFLNNLHLGPENRVSEPIDLDALDGRTRNKVDKAEKTFKLIKVLPQPNGTRPTFEVESAKPAHYVLPRHEPVSKIARRKAEQAEKTSKEPPAVDEEKMPDIESVTLADEPLSVEEIEEPEEPKIEKVEPTEEDFEEAEALLRQNGNTVKRVLRYMDRPVDEVKRFLLACLKIEKKRKKRKGTIAALEEAYLEVS